MKLREIEGQTAQLVWYARPDQNSAKRSDYRLVAVAHPGELRDALAAACGVRTVVEKRREIFLYNNVRIHLDEVSQLGEFIEFEAVLGPEVNESARHAQVEFLQTAFQLAVDDLVAVSYVELILRLAGGRESGIQPV
ncbi:MAG: class IV adenylate cyclase [Pirellulales bacterium]